MNAAEEFKLILGYSDHDDDGCEEGREIVNLDDLTRVAKTDVFSCLHQVISKTDTTEQKLQALREKVASFLVQHENSKLTERCDHDVKTTIIRFARTQSRQITVHGYIRLLEKGIIKGSLLEAKAMAIFGMYNIAVYRSTTGTSLELDEKNSVHLYPGGITVALLAYGKSFDYPEMFSGLKAEYKPAGNKNEANNNTTEIIELLDDDNDDDNEKDLNAENAELYQLLLDYGNKRPRIGQQQSDKPSAAMNNETFISSTSTKNRPANNRTNNLNQTTSTNNHPANNRPNNLNTAHNRSSTCTFPNDNSSKFSNGVFNQWQMTPRGGIHYRYDNGCCDYHTSRIVSKHVLCGSHVQTLNRSRYFLVDFVGVPPEKLASVINSRIQLEGPKLLDTCVNCNYYSSQFQIGNGGRIRCKDGYHGISLPALIDFIEYKCQYDVAEVTQVVLIQLIRNINTRTTNHFCQILLIEDYQLTRLLRHYKYDKHNNSFNINGTESCWKTSYQYIISRVKINDSWVSIFVDLFRRRINFIHYFINGESSYEFNNILTQLRKHLGHSGFNNEHFMEKFHHPFKMKKNNMRSYFSAIMGIVHTVNSIYRKELQKFNDIEELEPFRDSMIMALESIMLRQEGRNRVTYKKLDVW